MQLTFNNIVVVIPPLYVTNLFQVCNLNIFGPFKSHLQTLWLNRCHDYQEFIMRLCISVMRQATIPINIHARFLGRALREIENEQGNMVASFVMENIQVAIKKVSNEGILVIEAPTRITIQYATEP
ncbi:MAG: hypothetical protein EZS28_004767 [Streblomastix strix]|uniref:Uncharacterized protein n=1 Tax=Streblomastix strix TaxID=222440 RepID=A0A5J4WXA2_9EUKA|nr:MAG: hypothetical protein EZS28_004767 [Streblomastix strix]